MIFVYSYFTTEQISEFKLFLQTKSLNAMQLRHVRDHIELVQLQLQIIENLKTPD